MVDRQRGGSSTTLSCNQAAVVSGLTTFSFVNIGADRVAIHAVHALIRFYLRKLTGSLFDAYCLINPWLRHAAKFLLQKTGVLRFATR